MHVALIDEKKAQLVAAPSLEFLVYIKNSRLEKINYKCKPLSRKLVTRSTS